MAFQYELSFAGIPFVSDKGIAIRMGQVGNPFVENDLQTPRKHQVLSTLYDEINRIIPIELFQEFAPCTPSSYVDSLSTSPKQPMEVRLGEFFYPHGMSRWSVFRGLATTSIATAMLAATGGISPATFNLKSVPLSPDNPSGGNNTGVWSVSTNMYMMPPRCLADHGGQFEGLYLITLVDDRFFVQSSVTNLNITSLQTWEAVIVQLALDLGFSVSLASSISSVYGRPEPDSQLWVAGSQEAATLLDCVALNVGRSVVRNYDGNFVLYTPAESYAIALDNRGSDNPVRVAGGSFYALSNSVKAALPSEINVTFPKYIVGNDPVPHFYNPRYTSPRPTAWVEDSYGECYTITVPIADTGVGTTGISQWTIESVSKALYDTEAAAGASPTNRSFLLALSNRLATDRAQFQAYAFLDEVYPGTFAWEPEGLHDITWTYSERKGLASTRVTRYPWDEVMSKTSQHATFAVDGGFVISGGVGGKVVPQTWRDSYSGVAFGVNLVTLDSGLALTSSYITPGGVSEVVIGFRSGAIISGGNTSGCDCPCTSGIVTICVSGYPGPLVSNVYQVYSGYPYPLVSNGLAVISGYPYPLRSGTYVVVSGGWPYPLVSNGTYIFYGDYPYPLPSGYFALSSGTVTSGMLASGFIYELAAAFGSGYAPGGAQGNIQYNMSGIFGGASEFNYAIVSGGHSTITLGASGGYFGMLGATPKIQQGPISDALYGPAGVTYGATEQAMLNEAVTQLNALLQLARDVGLLSFT